MDSGIKKEKTGALKQTRDNFNPIMSSASLCKNCLFSSPITDGTDAGSAMLECSCDKFFQGYHIDAFELPLDAVHVEDDEGWAFTVGPEFGCIHWKQQT